MIRRRSNVGVPRARVQVKASTLREKLARRKISRNEWETAEIDFAPFRCPYCEWLGASEGALRREAADRFAAAARDLAGVPAVDLSREGRLHWRRLDNASFLKIAAALAERAPQVLDALYLRRQDLLDCSLAPLGGLSSLVTLDLAWCDPGQEKRAKFPTAKAPISAVSHSFRLVFGRAIISRNGLEAWMLFPERARAEHSR